MTSRPETEIEQTTPGIVVKQIRKLRAENEPQQAPSFADCGTPIMLPSSIELVRHQKRCRICGLSILESFSKTGWARCLETGTLVHGHCFDVTQQSHTNITNWCAVCENSCRKNQPMKIEGV